MIVTRGFFFLVGDALLSTPSIANAVAISWIEQEVGDCILSKRPRATASQPIYTTIDFKLFDPSLCTSP